MQTVGGRYVFHHMIWSTRVAGRRDQIRIRRAAGDDQRWPGRCTKWAATPTSSIRVRPGCSRPDSSIVSDSVHLHSNGRDTKAHLEIGFKFMPKDYKPKYRQALVALGNGVDIDIKAMTANQQLHAYAVLKENTKILSFEPHLHAPGSGCASKRSGATTSRR